MKRGDVVWIERDGQRQQATVVMASQNENAIAVTWPDGMVGGYCGMMALLREDGVYRDLEEQKPVKVERITATTYYPHRPRLPQQLGQKLQDLAWKRHKTLNALIVEILEEATK